jgi:hypothetical protein
VQQIRGAMSVLWFFGLVANVNKSQFAFSPCLAWFSQHRWLGCAIGMLGCDVRMQYVAPDAV